MRLLGQSGRLRESAEKSSTPVTPNADLTTVVGTRYYAFFTFPTTERFYLVSGIEWICGTLGGTGLVQAGIDAIDAIPPVITATPLQAVAQRVAYAGANITQRVSVLSRDIFRSGNICGIWLSSDSVSSFRELTAQANQNQRKATAFSAAPPTQDVTAWTASMTRIRLRLYFRGYS